MIPYRVGINSKGDDETQTITLGKQLETRILDDADSVVSKQYTKLAHLGVLCGCCDNNHSARGQCPGGSNATDNLLCFIHNYSCTWHSLYDFFQTTSAPSLVQFWQQQAGLGLQARDLAALEEILQADLEERTWRMVEQAEAAAAAVDETHG